MIGGLITSLTTPDGTGIVPKWSDIFDVERSEAVPNDLIGATIYAIGTPSPNNTLEGGGLAIEYIPACSSERKRLTLAFNELGMWVSSLCKSDS